MHIIDIYIYILISSSTPGASKCVLERNLRRRMFTLATTLGFSKGGDNPVQSSESYSFLPSSSITFG